MSYILEALKRADAERQRGGVPGLHAQTGRGVTAAEPGAVGGRPWGLAAAALALLLIGGAVVGWWRAGPVAPPAAVSGAPALPVGLPPVTGPVAAGPTVPLTEATAAAAVAARSAAPPAAPPAAVLPPPRSAANAEAQAALVPASPPPALPGLAVRPLPAPGSAPPSMPTPTPTPTAAPRALGVPGSASTTPATVAPALAAAAPVAAAPERLLQLAELPDAVRREVGPLNPGGSVYAEQPAARMVILNGQVFREGDLLAAQLRVEQIRPRSVVLSLRGQRFELAL